MQLQRPCCTVQPRIVHALIKFSLTTAVRMARIAQLDRIMNPASALTRTNKDLLCRSALNILR